MPGAGSRKLAASAAKRASLPGLSQLGENGERRELIGLFGTVWGILLAFQKIGTSGTTSIAEVGPFIAEALVATAVGLLVAIPAVVAFNYLTRQVKKAVGSSNALNQQVLFRLRAEDPE